MSVFEEEKLLPGALDSLTESGISELVVFDGAWRGFGYHADDCDAELGMSRDETINIAEDRGIPVVSFPLVWDSQEHKRSAMFHGCGAQPGDHVFVFDADERLEGRFPDLTPGVNYNVMVKCVGPNDMPGIRGVWPRGDYYDDYKPELRVFAYDPQLECKWPGGYWNAAGKIEPYVGSASRLPVVPGLSFTHHGNEREPERIAKKVDFYQREHPRRVERQNAEWRKNPW